MSKTIFDQLTEARAKITELETSLAATAGDADRIATLEDDLASTGATIYDLNARLGVTQENVDALTRDLADARKQAADLQAEVEALRTASETAEVRAAAIVGGMGVSPAAVTEAGDASGALPTGDAARQYAALLATDPRAAHRFYTENKAAILGGRR